MTTPLSPQAQKMLDEITELIAEKELRLGCEIIGDGERYLIINENGEWSSCMRSNNYAIISKLFSFSSYKILGTPPDFCRVIYWINKTTKRMPHESFYLNWDLSKPLLRDQSEYLIRFLHPLF